MNARVATAAGIFLALCGAAVGVDSEDRFNSRTFLTQTAFGSIAHVPSAFDTNSARTAHNLNRLPKDACVAIPSKGELFFRLNHRLEGMSGRTAYFSVRVVLREAVTDANRLTLFRNEGWIGETDVALPKFDKTQPELAIGVPEFLHAHLDGVGKPPEDVAAFHARFNTNALPPDPSDHDSKDDRFLIQAIAGAIPEQSRLLVMHLKFDVTEKRESVRAPVFSIRPGNATEAQIFVASPALREGDNNYSVRVMLDGQCP